MVGKLRSIRNLLLTTLGMLSLITAVSVQAQSMNNLNVYVWDFSTRDGKKDELTNNLTREFEEALLQKGCYTVLERRNYDRLLAQGDTEKAIMNMAEISQSSLDNFNSVGANAFIFGEVYDDVQSGQIKVTAFVQAFNGKIVAIEGVRFSRGKRFDAASREAKIQGLAEELCSSISTPPPTPASLPEPVVKITKLSDGAPVSSSIEVTGTYTEEVTSDIWVMVWPEKAPGRGYPQTYDAAQGTPALKRDGRWSVMCHFGGPPQSYEIAVYTASPTASQFIANSLRKWVENDNYPGLHITELPEGLRERVRIQVRKE